MSEKLEVEIIGKVSGFQKSMKDAEKASTSAANNITKSVNSIGSSVAANLAGAFSSAAIVGFGKAVISVTAEFQKFQAVLGNTLGSSALANLKLKEIQDFAEKTPFAVNELTGAFVKLANSGFKPTGAEMVKLGDLAASTGKSFDQLAEAILDAQTGEFERLKEFGVRAKDAGDKVIFTFKGVQTTVEKSSAAIRDYVTGLGAAEGVSGAMAKISETLGGKISNLGDSWDQMLLSVGSNTNGVFSSSISIIAKAIDSITAFNRELDLASKFDINKTFGQKLDALYKYSPGGLVERIFGGEAATNDFDKKIQSVVKARDGVAKFTAISIEAAKSSADFGKALAALKAQSEIVLKTFNDPKAAKAVLAAYQEGVKAIQDARTEFLNPKGGKANFGTVGAKDEADKIKAIYIKLSNEIAKLPLQMGSDAGDIKEGTFAAYQSAINSLVDLGVKPASKAITELQSKMRALIGDRKELAPTGPQQLLGLDKLKATVPAEIKIVPITNMSEVISKLNQDFEALSQTVLQSGVEDAFAAVGTAIGETISSGGDALAGLGQSLLGIIAGIANKLGKAAIAIGVTMEGIKNAFKNPFTAIAAGIALIAVGALISSTIPKMTRGESGGNSSRPSGNFTAFANGGIVSGPTMGLVGEYPGARSNPEVIAPLNKLKGLLGNNSPDIQFNQRIEIEGDKLVVLIDKVNSKRKRIG